LNFRRIRIKRGCDTTEPYNKKNNPNKEVNMLIIEGIYNGKTVDLSETVPFKKKKKVFVTFPDDLSEKTELTVTSAQVLLDLFGSWEDSRDAEEIVRESRGFLKKSRFSTQRYFEMKQDEKNLEK
jgi:hypothetical protein